MPHPTPGPASARSSSAERRAFAAARVHRLVGGEEPRRDHAVLCEGDRIAAVVARADVPRGVEVVDFEDVDLAPGFVDVQVNGGGGALFNEDPSVETIRRIAEAHRRFGTTGLLPTFITDSIDAMRSARVAIDEALAAGEPGVLGVHFEGPWLDDRKTGAHDRSHVRGPTPNDLEVMLGGAAGATLVTAAANRLSSEVLSTLLEAGVVVSLGHCASTYAEAMAAFAGGVTGVTHLYNAMSPLEGRAPGLVGAALATSGVRAGLILDGVHVDFGSALAAYRALGPDRTMLVTDAVQPVGSDVTSFRLGGMDVRLEDGRCLNEEGKLAGSALDMCTAVANAVDELGATLPDALAMASRTPSRFIGLADEVGTLAPGLRADLVALGRDERGRLRCAATVVGGELHAV